MTPIDLLTGDGYTMLGVARASGGRTAWRVRPHAYRWIVDRTREGMVEAATRLARSLEADGATPSDDGERERAEAVIGAAKRLRSVIESTPWEFISETWLTSVEASFAPVEAMVESWISSEDQPVFPVAWGHLDAMWAAIGLFLPAIPAGSPDALAADVAAARERLTQIVAELSEQVERRQEQRDALEEHLTALDDRQVAIIADIETRHAAYEAETTQQTARLEAAIRQNQEQFSTAQAKQLSDFGELLDEARAALSVTLAEHNEKAEEKLAKAEANAAATFDWLTELEAKATRSYHATGTATNAGYYQGEANKQRKAANTWRLVGVTVLGLFALATVLELILGDTSPSVNHTLARLPIAAAAAALAGYTLRESAAHRRQEQLLRKREIDLASIDPILANIKNKEAAEQIKLDHARVLFSGGDDQRPDDDVADSV